ncbi:MAG: hypothetical protein R3D58_13070 [Saprospiraceae bacterium]
MIDAQKYFNRKLMCNRREKKVWFWRFGGVSVWLFFEKEGAGGREVALQVVYGGWKYCFGTKCLFVGGVSICFFGKNRRLE